MKISTFVAAAMALAIMPTTLVQAAPPAAKAPAKSAHAAKHVGKKLAKHTSKKHAHKKVAGAKKLVVKKAG